MSATDLAHDDDAAAADDDDDDDDNDGWRGRTGIVLAI